jgi:hypothetical protein
LLTILWLTATVALAAAILALLSVRRAARQAEQLSEAYWQLRYEHGQLMSRVVRLEPSEAGHQPEPTAAPSTRVSTFVPLSSIKR